MGLDISFQGDDPRLAELDGQRLTNVSGFLNLTLTLGTAFKMLNDPDDPMNQGFYRSVADYANGQEWAESRFEQYLAFLGRFAEQAQADLGYPLTVSAYDPVARKLTAALLLRDDPVDVAEAEKISGFFSFIAGWIRAMGGFMEEPPEGQTGVARPGWAAQVLDKYERCLAATQETGVAFKIDF